MPISAYGSSLNDIISQQSCLLRTTRKKPALRTEFIFANKCTLIRNQKSFTVPTIYNSQEHKPKLFSLDNFYFTI